MKAVKNVAQDVIHAYDTADEDANVAWEIIEDIMEGLIAVYLDTFKWDDGKSEDYAVSIGGQKIPLHKNLTESDMERDIDSLEERVDEIDENVEWVINEVIVIKEKIAGYVFERKEEGDDISN